MDFYFYCMTHWADSTAEKLIEREKSPVIETGTSISGIPHVGNASDVIRGDAIRKALEQKNKDAKFMWVADDSDPFRKIPANLGQLKDYLGFPVKSIPDLDGCHDSFVDHHVEKFLSELKDYGVSPEVYSALELYRSNAFEKELKTVLDKKQEVIEILNKFRSQDLPEDAVLWKPICSECGRISTTRSLTEEKGIVSYVCQDAQVAGGKVGGCGHRGESDIFQGQGKMPWRVEWAMRWKHFNVTCEPLGKEHASSGGSFWSARLVSERIFDWQPPEPVIYEFFTLNGEKISSSQGNVITLGGWMEICEPEVLKYFMYKKLKKQRDIKLKAIPNLVDEYDHMERIYYGINEGDEEEARLYELSQIQGAYELPLQVPFTLCAVLAQIVPDYDLNEIEKRLRIQGYGLPDEDYSLKRLKNRLKAAGNWIREHGPEHLRFKLISAKDSKDMLEKLQENEKKALNELAAEVEEEPDPESLHKRIYEISRANDIKPPRMFGLIYKLFIGKNRGPKAAMFLSSLDPKEVRKRIT